MEATLVDRCVLVTFILFVIFMSLYFIGFREVRRRLCTLFLGAGLSGYQIL